MRMNNRIDIKNFITQIEKDFPINNWEIYGIKIWPFIRIRLFFYLINEIELSKKQTQFLKPTTPILKRKISERLITFLKYGLKSRIANSLGIIYSYLWIYNLPKKSYLFLGTDAHRVVYKNSRFNRYFDVYIEQNNLKDDSIYFEYDNKQVENYYNEKLIYKYNSALTFFKKYKIKVKKRISMKDEKSYISFLSFLYKIEQTNRFATEYNTEKIKKLFLNISYNVIFFKKVLKKVKPKEIFILCYYSDEIMSLIHVANILGIKTIEMQHGSQTDAHLAYGSWNNIPKEGYSTIPSEYWCWDTDSANVLSKWINNTTKYSVKITGNFWVNYWKKIDLEYKYKDFILYSLQPLPITIEELFPINIINLIKNTPQLWFIRLHPRQYEFKKHIEYFLNLNKVLDKVNIEDATNDPLPLLLKYSIIHITHSSTTVIEASFFNKQTILINEIGKDYYPELINSGRAKYINVNNKHFIEEFEKALEHEINKNEY